MNGPICIRCGQPIATMPIATPQGYQHDRCPSSGMSTGAIAALAGCGVLLLLALTLGAFVALWQFLEPTPRSATGPTPLTTATGAPAEPAEALSLKFATKNGLVTVSYPPSFAASTPNEHDVLLQRRSANAGEIVVAVDAIDHPISDHLEEVDRVVRIETGKRYAGFVAGPTTPTTCHDHPGVASSGTFTLEGVSYESRACAFMNGAHYHRCFYVAPAADLVGLEPLFQQICAGVEIR